MSFRKLYVIAALALVLYSSGGISAQAAAIEITARYPMTGPAAFIGQGQSQTLRIIEQMVNAQGGIHGHPLKFLIQDPAPMHARRSVMGNASLRSARTIPTILPKSANERVAINANEMGSRC
jgi:branched-chain amino acid transport system substrate-binding protein